MTYGGFYISKNAGNNKFAYQKRKESNIRPEIFVPELKKVPADIEIIKDSFMQGNRTAFAEYDEENQRLIECKGLENFLYFELGEKKIHIFDNHNHAFYFVAENFDGEIMPMLHFDQHKDMRKPDMLYREFVRSEKTDFYSSKAKSDYTNYVLNVGNFIEPLLRDDFISNVKIVDSSYSLADVLSRDFYTKEYTDGLVLDIDLDFFSTDMDYIDAGLKLSAISKAFSYAKTVTISTSPYFIEFERAGKYLFEILEIFLKIKQN